MKKQVLCIMTMLPFAIMLILGGSLMANSTMRNLTQEEVVQLTGGCLEYCNVYLTCVNDPPEGCAKWNGKEGACNGSNVTEQYNGYMDWTCDEDEGGWEYCNDGDYGLCAYLYECEYWSTCGNCEWDQADPDPAIDGNRGCEDGGGSYGTW